jgi:carbon monoxide dehydrogenase subunit G
MIIENSFDVDADPDRVFEFLQNPHNVATCFPGAELTEDLGDDQYKGKVKIKLGPVTAAFTGIAKITEKDEAARIAVLVAEGKDARGSGTAKATATMRVEPTETGSSVLLKTDLTISGKLAQFGRGIMADVSGRMVNDLAVRVRERIESESAAAASEAEAAAPETAAAETAASAEAGSTAGSEAEATAGTATTSGTDSGAVSGATAGTATTTAPGKATAPAAASAAAKAPARPSGRPTEPEEPAGAIKASTLLKVMIAGMFRRLFARLRGRGAESRNS